MLRSTLCNYNDKYILARATKQSQTQQQQETQTRKKNIIIKNYAPFTNCISGINNTQIDNAKHKETDIVIAMYNLIEYGDNYSKTTATLWKLYEMSHL